jgi:hypothetical protein
MRSCMNKWRHSAAEGRTCGLGRWSVCLLCAGTIAIETTNASAQPMAEDPSIRMQPVRPIPELADIHLDTKSGWSAGLEGYAGLTTLSTDGGTKGHALAGGITRGRFSYVELGAALEVSDNAGERWRSLGGFAGAYLPFTNWVDIDATIGFGMRTYVSTDRSYGPTGTSVSVPALMLRLGVSDRVVEGLVGPRLGAALLVGFDLKHGNVDWSYTIPGEARFTGTSQFGGITAGLVMTLGFDVALRTDRGTRRPPSRRE